MKLRRTTSSVAFRILLLFAGCALFLLLFALFYLSSPDRTSALKEKAELNQDDNDDDDKETQDFERNSVLNTEIHSDNDDDPMSRFMVGYPLKPLSLEELRLCDEKQTILLQGSYTCASDPSCLACVKPSQLSRFNEIHNAFRNPEVQERRQREIQAKFADQSVIALFTFNYAHADLFLNWACSAHKLGLRPTDFTLVIPCDQMSAKLIRELGFTVLNPEWQDLLQSPIHSRESFWGQDHADINNIALFAMNDLVALGFHVFVHDADIAWLRNPLPFFAKSIRRRDFLGMLAPFWTSMGPVNTGLLYLSPTPQLRVFLQSMENAAVIKGTSDQRLWNTILRHFSFQQLEWRLLPQSVVYKYSGSRAEPPNQNTLLMHAVGSGKREKLNRYGLWLLTKDCPFYDETVDALNQKEREKKAR